MRGSYIGTPIGLLACACLLSLAPLPAGAQASRADLTTASSSTVAADHRALAMQYRAHAAELEADATVHEALAADLKARPADDDAWDLARDAAHYAQHSREAAEALRDLAQLHESIADRVGLTEREAAPPAGGCCGKGMADKGKAITDKTKGTAGKNPPVPAAPDHAAH